MPVQQKRALEILGQIYGGSGGAAFDDRSHSHFGLLTQVTLQAGLFVDAISITYGTHITWHGGPGGYPSNLTLKPGEYITRVEGRAGTWLDYLKLTTNLGQTVEAGGQGGEPFTVPNPDGLALSAISGRAGSLIDEIQFVFGPPPATSQPAAKKAATRKAVSAQKKASAPKKAPAKKAAAKPESVAK